MYEEIHAMLLQEATEEVRASTLYFAPTAKHVLGIRMPYLNDLAKKYKAYGWPLVQELWSHGFCEERILAAKILGHISGKYPDESLRFLDQIKSDIDNWAVCDTLAQPGLRKAYKKIPEEIDEKAYSYLSDTNPWIIRLGIVLLLHAAKVPEKRSSIQKALHSIQSKEKYVMKALVWIRKYLDA